MLLEFDQNGKGGNFGKYVEKQKRISIISTADPSDDRGILFHENRRREELKKIKLESKSISRILECMGINHFVIDINEDAIDENIVIRYSNSGTDKNKLRNSLSEGEKTALAFAYFLSKFNNERGSGEKIKESTIVIDDPISSLDENRLYSTAYLIRDNFKLAKQLIVISHNFLFLKFFNASFDGRKNYLFIDGEKLSELPEEMQNFESPYFYMLKIIMQYANNSDSMSYNDAKKYLPNYIRRVLETFLSFKFAKIANRPGGRRSPGLNEFDNEIDSIELGDTEKNNLKAQIAKIVKITDQHSHGNAQLTEENFYISEGELKILSQSAISIIDTLDSVHKAVVSLDILVRRNR